MIESLTDAHFIRPWCLLLAPVAVVVWWFWRNRTEPLRAWREQMDPDLLEALAVQEGGGHDSHGWWLLAAWLLTVVAVSGPTWRPEPNPFAEFEPPLMILMKSDSSMAGTAASPTHLERAQLKIADLAELRKGQPMGLIAYAGSTHLVLPPTRDTKVVAEIASQISPDIMPVPGDRLDLAIREAGRVLSGSDSGGSLLVISDSVGGDAQAIAAAHTQAGSLPVQFLALTGDDTPQTRSIEDAADLVGGSVQSWTVDDQDITRIAGRASRRSAAGARGDSARWQEMGYWLTPLIVLAVALSFRRESLATRPGAT
jgi:Ca-activated chloride channel family protein